MDADLFKKKAAAGAYDFLDFGASKGASIEYAKAHLFGKKGLGVDLDPERVEIMNKAGYDCMVGDLTNLELPRKCVKFVKMAHILEHLPDLKGIEKAIESGKKAATDFLVITGPYFDADEYLASKGLKLHWADYSNHYCHLKVSQFIDILKKLGLDDYELYLRYPIKDSLNEHIHPLSSPTGAHHYDAAVHPVKRHVKFDQAVWVDFVCYIRLGKPKNWDQITKAYTNQIPYIEQNRGVRFEWPKGAVKKYIEMDRELQTNKKALRDLKADKKQLIDKLSKSQQKLRAIESSRSWRLARQSQRISSVAKHPEVIIKKAKTIAGL